MASPFEVQSPQLGDSVYRRNEEFHVRDRTRESIIEKRVNTRFKPLRDILWQRNPDRILKYRPSHLHYYGWIPFSVWRNLKATVFSEVYLYIQNLVLLAWMAALHVSGLGVRDEDLATLVAMFGTPYLGAIFNYGMVVVFILGLFITLVINRWWTIRAAYTKLMGTTTDLCMLVASTVQNPNDIHDDRTSRARTEITRLLNLGHLLVIAKADALNGDFTRSYGIRTMYRSMTSSFNSFFYSDKLTSKFSNQSGSPTFTRALFKPRNLVSLDTLVSEGFMNEDEWATLTDGEREGMPAHHMVYYWTQCLVNKCCAANLVISAPQMLPLMLNKINTIVESGSSIITTINSQMPYPYVHLVSFVVHSYLIVLATWFGCFLHTGRLGENFTVPGGAATKSTDDVDSSVWMVFWCYLLMTMANVTFQGLLDMHTLLDNPFGNHCTKFALRANVSAVTNASRTMLLFADKLPTAFGDIFQSGEPDDVSVPPSAIASRPSAQQEPIDFLHPRPTGQFPLTSVNSFTTAEVDRSAKASIRGRERRLADLLSPGMSSVSRRTQSSDPRSTPNTKNLGVDSPQQPERVKSAGTTPERPPLHRLTGADVIQERFLQGAGRSVESSATRSNPQQNSPPNNPPISEV